MTQTPFPSAEPAPAVRYRIVGPQTWALVREDYLSGTSARVCAARWGVGESNLKRRAREEGWTRRNHAARLETQRPVAAPAPGPAAGEPAGALDVPLTPVSLKGCAIGDTAPDYNPMQAATIAARTAAWRASRGDGRGAMEMLKVADHLASQVGELEGLRIKTAQADRAEAHAKREQEQLKAMELEDVLSSLRRDIMDKREELEALKADLASADARLTATLTGTLAGGVAPAEPEAGEPQAEPARAPGPGQTQAVVRGTGAAGEREERAGESMVRGRLPGSGVGAAKAGVSGSAHGACGQGESERQGRVRSDVQCAGQGAAQRGRAWAGPRRCARPSQDFSRAFSLKGKATLPPLAR